MASALIAQIDILVKSALKMHCTNFFFFFFTKVVTNQKPQPLYYVTFFDILRNFGVIAAYGTHRESFVPSYGTDFFFSFGCLYVCGHDNS